LPSSPNGSRFPTKTTTTAVRPDEVYSEEELQRVIGATKAGSLERVLVMMPALTGFRNGEVLGLTGRPSTSKRTRFTFS